MKVDLRKANKSKQAVKLLRECCELAPDDLGAKELLDLCKEAA